MAFHCSDDDEFEEGERGEIEGEGEDETDYICGPDADGKSNSNSPSNEGCPVNLLLNDNGSKRELVKELLQVLFQDHVTSKQTKALLVLYDCDLNDNDVNVLFDKRIKIRYPVPPLFLKWSYENTNELKSMLEFCMRYVANDLKQQYFLKTCLHEYLMFGNCLVLNLEWTVGGNISHNRAPAPQNWLKSFGKFPKRARHAQQSLKSNEENICDLSQNSLTRVSNIGLREERGSQDKVGGETRSRVDGFKDYVYSLGGMRIEDDPHLKKVDTRITTDGDGFQKVVTKKTKKRGH